LLLAVAPALVEVREVLEDVGDAAVVLQRLDASQRLFVGGERADVIPRLFALPADSREGFCRPPPIASPIPAGDQSLEGVDRPPLVRRLPRGPPTPLVELRRSPQPAEGARRVGGAPVRGRGLGPAGEMRERPRSRRLEAYPHDGVERVGAAPTVRDDAV